MADGLDPRNTGENIAQGIPGVNILQLIRQFGEQLPGLGQRAMELLGIPTRVPPTGQPRQSVDEALRRQAVEEQLRRQQGGF